MIRKNKIKNDIETKKFISFKKNIINLNKIHKKEKKQILKNKLRLIFMPLLILIILIFVYFILQNNIIRKQRTKIT